MEWRKSVVWLFLTMFIISLGSWLFDNIGRRLAWSALGCLVGIAAVLGYVITDRRHKRQVARAIALGSVVTFSLTALLNGFDKALPEVKVFKGFTAGVLFPIVSALLIYQICKKRVVTWDDIVGPKYGAPPPAAP